MSFTTDFLFSTSICNTFPRRGSYRWRPYAFSAALPFWGLTVGILLNAHSAIAAPQDALGVPPSITVSAKAIARTEANSMLLTVTLSETATSFSAAEIGLKSRKEKVFQALRAKNAGEPLVRASSFSSTPSSASSTLPKPAANPALGPGKPLTLRQSIAYHVSDLAQAALQADAALAAGAESVELEYESPDTSSAVAEAGKEAAKRARAKAETIAATLGAKVGSLIDVDVLEEPPGSVLRREMQLDPSSKQFTEAVLEVHLTARFSLLHP